MTIYFFYSQVPELAGLSRERCNELIIEGGRRFGQTPQFKRVWLLGLFISFIIPATVGPILYFWQNSSDIGVWSFVGLGLIGYSVWFHIRTSCLRPHIRAYLAKHETSKT